MRNNEFEKISNAIDALLSLTGALNNCRIDPDPYWERAQAACEQCAQPTRDALLIVMSSLACDVMYEAEGTNPELAIMARAVMKAIPPVHSQDYADKEETQS